MTEQAETRSITLQRVLADARKLNPEDRRRLFDVLADEFEDDEEESEWEVRMLEEKLADYIQEDGELDYKQLAADAEVIDLEELHTKDKAHEQ